MSTELIEKVWGKPAHLEIDRCAFQFAYRSVVGCDDYEQRRLDLERALLKVMDEEAAGYCMAVLFAAVLGENRRCREEFTDEEPHVLNENGDWDHANKSHRYQKESV